MCILVSWKIPEDHGTPGIHVYYVHVHACTHALMDFVCLAAKLVGLLTGYTRIHTHKQMCVCIYIYIYIYMYMKMKIHMYLQT